MAQFTSAGHGTREDIDKGMSAKAEKPGRYRTKITAVKQHMDEESPNVMLVMKVTGTGPRRDPIDSVMFHRIYFTPKSMKSVLKFYLRMELLVEREPDVFVDADGNECIDSDALNILVGEEVCAEWKVERGEYNGKETESLRAPFNEFWRASDPIVKDWDCNQAQDDSGDELAGV